MIAPHVAIAGGGPAGFLCALLFSNCGIPVTVFEQSAVADPWSTKSFSISLNARGMTALDTAGVLEAAKLAGTARHKVIMEMPNGMQKEIPKDPPNYAVTRPALVESLEQCLEAKALGNKHITIRRGVSVTNIDMSSDMNNDSVVTVSLDDGSTVDCTHVVAADGKWSAVRTAVPDWKDKFQVQSEPAFGIIISPKTSTPKRWAADASTLFLSKNPMYYCLAAPLPNGQYSVSAICVDEIKDQHPWLVPEDDKDTVDWEAEHGIGSSTEAKASVQEMFSKMLQEDLPLFYKDLNEGDSTDDAENTVVRINRRTSWLKPLTDTPNYSDATGRVVLVGDSAHAMTPSQGEGCNCALESAATLVESLLQKGDEITVDDLTQAFLRYGTKRPPEVVPMQIKSAVANRYKERPQPPPSKK